MRRFLVYCQVAPSDRWRMLIGRLLASVVRAQCFTVSWRTGQSCAIIDEESLLTYAVEWVLVKRPGRLPNRAEIRLVPGLRQEVPRV